MKTFIISILLALSIAGISQSQSNFKKQQLRFDRVRTAYNEKRVTVNMLLQNQKIDTSRFKIFICAFKDEAEFEVWAKPDSSNRYRLITTYKICLSSGGIGPKRREGDLQVPEGFYYINDFNPNSTYYLSLGLNYPNPSDRVFADKRAPGSAIYIHGDCVTIGCIPLEERIKELYILCVEARNHGQQQIPVWVFPKRLNKTNYDQLLKQYALQPEWINLWTDLKTGYDYFEKNRSIPAIQFQKNGRHHIGK